MATMAWGGFTNGAIPMRNLVNFEGTGKLLQADAAAWLTRLFDATKKATGARPYIAAHQDLFRDLDEQISLLGQNYTAVTSGAYAFVWNKKKWRKTGPITCAIPGTSNHGWARAADITFPTAASRKYFRDHCGDGYWTNAGDAFGEDWHKEYHGPITTITPAGGGATPIDGDDDMPLSARELELLQSASDAAIAIKAFFMDGTPANGDTRGNAITNAAIRLRGIRSDDPTSDYARGDLLQLIRGDIGNIGTAAIDYDRLAEAIVAKLPAASSGDPAAIAKAVRAEFAADPLK